MAQSGTNWATTPMVSPSHLQRSEAGLVARALLAPVCMSAGADEKRSDKRAARLLIAEDDPELRLLLVSGLRRDGYEVEEARDGRDLVSRVREILTANPEGDLVVVSDVRMPYSSGFQALYFLKHWRGVRVILMTAFGGPEARARALALGASDLLDKPFELDTLRGAIRTALSNPR